MNSKDIEKFQFKDVIVETNTFETRETEHDTVEFISPDSMVGFISPDSIKDSLKNMKQTYSASKFIEPYFSNEIVVNEQGGKQSKIKTAFHAIPQVALFKAAEVLAEGLAKYGRDNWRRIPAEEHAGRAMEHISAYLGGDNCDNHLAHAICRVMFALECDLGVEAKPDHMKE